MIKFNKVFNLRIISSILACVFLLTNIAYGIDFNDIDIAQALRIPMGVSEERAEEAYYRQICKSYGVEYLGIQKLPLGYMDYELVLFNIGESTFSVRKNKDFIENLKKKIAAVNEEALIYALGQEVRNIINLENECYGYASTLAIKLRANGIDCEVVGKNFLVGDNLTGHAYVLTDSGIYVDCFPEGLEEEGGIILAIKGGSRYDNGKIILDSEWMKWADIITLKRAFKETYRALLTLLTNN
ncbi:MAG: hypothetical protein Q7O04_08060 [Candidatus Omnitrophota bacterium]|nr:hypothetical protein [Candidatus Omnitrophota bacterium]